MKITEFLEVFKTFSNIYNRIPEIEQNIVVDNDYYGGMGGGSIVPKTNLVELDVNNYRELYVFNTLDFEIPMKQMKNIDIHILPNESCQIDYSIEYFYKGKKIKKCDKCFESAVVKVPQFKLNPANSIQFQVYVFNVLAKDNIRKYKKGNIVHIDKQISSNLEDIKKAFEIKTIGTVPNFK